MTLRTKINSSTQICDLFGQFNLFLLYAVISSAIQILNLQTKNNFS